MTNKRNSANFIFVLLGLLTAFGPFVTDMYLPALPVMTKYFDTDVSMVQLGLTSSMLGLALGQLFFGPLSDRVGRRRPLLWAMAVFIVSTAGCIAAPDIQTFVALRFLQGAAASGGIVIARSIATDKFKSKNLAKALAIVGAINGMAPIAAPVIGGMVLQPVGWQGIFIILLGIGIVLAVFCLFFKESLSTQRRSKEKLSRSFKLFAAVLRNKKFVCYMAELSFALAILFSYIASSPFIIQEHYGFSPRAFSFFFAANAVAIGIGAGVSVKFKSPLSCLTASCAGVVPCCFVLAVLMPVGIPVAAYETLLFVLCFSLGLSFTAATAAAMDAERTYSGTASAVMGAAGFLLGGVVSPLVGLGNILACGGAVMSVFALLTVLAVIKAKRMARGGVITSQRP